MTKETTEVTVSEDKFNGTSTLEVVGIDDKKMVKSIARNFFREQYGHSASKVVAEKDEFFPSENRWDVMVADHSSGSLKGSETYEVQE